MKMGTTPRKMMFFVFPFFSFSPPGCPRRGNSKTRPPAPATLEARKRFFDDFQLLSIKWVTEEGRVEGDGGYKSFCMGAKSRRRTIFLGSEVGHGQGWGRHG